LRVGGFAPRHLNRWASSRYPDAAQKKTKSFMININLILKRKDSDKWRKAGEIKLPVVPRVGEHIALFEDNESSLFKVVSILHTVPFKGLTEVFAVYDGEVFEHVQRHLQDLSV
jgi:hypothetical protein